MEAIVALLGFVLMVLFLESKRFHLSTVFRVLKILTVISLLLPVLVVVWIVIDPPQIEDAAYLPEMFVTFLSLSTACIGGLAFAWLAGYVYWRYAKKNNLFEISSPQVALMLIAAIAGWMITPILVMLMLFGGRY